MNPDVIKLNALCNQAITDNDLIDDALVDNAEKIATEFGYSKIPLYCDQRLDDALHELNNTWARTTDNIKENNNPGFSIRETRTGQKNWNLLYDSTEKLDDAFFKNQPKAEIANIVMYIGDRLDMWRGFTHMKDRYTKRKKPLPLAINACLLSEAFGFGALKMADMSDLEPNQLRAIREDFVRVDTLCAANDIVSNHILNLIDDMQLRKAIRSARNRTEAYHQLQSNIRKTYNGIFQGKRVVENRVSAHAARLVANCIIAYNSMILNSVYEKMKADNVAQEVIDEFSRISPIAWTHMLFTGRYNFKKNNGKIDVEAMAQILEEHVKKHFWSDDHIAPSELEIID